MSPPIQRGTWPFSGGMPADWLDQAARPPVRTFPWPGIQDPVQALQPRIFAVPVPANVQPYQPPAGPRSMSPRAAARLRRISTPPPTAGSSAGGGRPAPFEATKRDFQAAEESMRHLNLDPENPAHVSEYISRLESEPQTPETETPPVASGSHANDKQDGPGPSGGHGTGGTTSRLPEPVWYRSSNFYPHYPPPGIFMYDRDFRPLAPQNDQDQNGQAGGGADNMEALGNQLEANNMQNELRTQQPDYHVEQPDND